MGQVARYKDSSINMITANEDTSRLFYEEDRRVLPLDGSWETIVERETETLVCKGQSVGLR